MYRHLRALLLLAPMILLGTAIPGFAQDRDVPYWASLRYDEVNMRVGPSGEYPIEWVYQRKGLPVKVIRLREGWRLVRDPDGDQGWIASSQLDPDRGAIVIGTGLADIRERPDQGSALKWRAEPGVVGKLLICDKGWCELEMDNRQGWIRQDRLWGAGEP